MIDPALVAAAVAEVEAEQRQPTSQDLSYLRQALQEATRENQLAEARIRRMQRAHGLR